MSRILCKLSFHDWVVKPATFYNEASEFLWITREDQRRRCSRCNREEVLYRVLLGVNPPEYADKWVKAPQKVTNITVCGVPYT